ncbi:MAG: Oligosaccharyltransferase PglB (EC [uncultured Sulfurovum sp.]|uniref:Oligosaccharyltransferase PglB (EC) n=1 Tax=uncultured Sulfurovum sp. TaxID=269237 RepID=A0A6S6SM10_9BACT|nr:MAG: Oligosaccharyltransferase PglB (EC [uncultured Sulfurovum sp.]
MKQTNKILSNELLENKLGLLLLLMLVAYAFSMGVRMYWPLHFEGEAAMMYANELMINTNDGYFFSTGARDVIDGVTALDRQRASAYDVSPGLVLLTAYATKFLPFSLDTVSLYLPGIIASLIVIPIILTGRLMGNTGLGFLAALLGSIAWSYYNRTMVGYYDTDMFSVFMQFMIFYSFLQIVYRKSIGAILFSSFMIFIYPYFYSQGMTLVYAMYVLLVIYLFLEHEGRVHTIGAKGFKENALSLYATVMLVSIPLMIMLPIEVRMILFVLIFILLLKLDVEEKILFAMAAVFFVGFLIFSNIFMVIWGNITAYAVRGVDAGSLQFYQVVQTVREAGAIPFETMANRISGSQIGVILSLIGYMFLVMRHKAFLIALPLIGVGVFSMWGGLRFTVYAVPVAALSAIYLLYILGDLIHKKVENIKNKNLAKYGFIILATVALIYPNIKHIEGYLVPTVLNKTEVNDLVKLDAIASNKDYTLTWWDYGYPIWYYSNTNTLIDGGKHTHDNYIVSKLMFSDSPQQVANLSKLAIETYVDSNYSLVADTLFNSTDKSPNQFLHDLKKKDYALPKKTREVYLYLPYRMLRIFPTVSVFGNLNLKTGRAERTIHFYPTQPVKQEGSKVLLQNGIIFDFIKGEIELQGTKKKVQRFDTVAFGQKDKILVDSKLMHMDGEYAVVFLKSYNQMIVMDKKTYNSTYVQMFMLGKYDKNLFELVVSSPYSKIYKVK